MVDRLFSQIQEYLVERLATVADMLEAGFKVDVE
jgi:hypothetical protein